MDFKFKASDIVKHSANHVMAAAVKRLFPNVKIGVGPVTPKGFYYDFHLERDLVPEDLELIEKNINQIIQENLQFKRIMLPKNESYNMLLQIGQIFKAELVQAIPDEQISFYKLGDEFIDLCRGPHVKSTSQIGIIKLTDIEYVHWNEDETRPRMSRVHGVVFQNIVEFNEYKEATEKQERRNFVKFSRNNNLGYVKDKEFFLNSRGNRIINNISDFILEELNQNNLEVFKAVNATSPEEASFFFNENLKTNTSSYKSIPRRIYTEIEFTENVSKINAKNLGFIIKTYTRTQNALMNIGDLLEKVTDVVSYITKEDYHLEIRCSDLDNTYVKSISTILQKKIVSHNKILTKNVGENIEISFQSTDSIGKNWNLGKIVLEARDENLVVMNEDGKNEELNQFYLFFNLTKIFSYLIEEFELNIPFAFKHNQITIIPHSTNEYDSANDLKNKLESLNLSVYLDRRSRSFKSKIKASEEANSGFIIIIGKKEELNNAVSIRHKGVESGLINSDSIFEYVQEHKDK